MRSNVARNSGQHSQTDDSYRAEAIASLNGRALLANTGIPLDLNWVQEVRVKAFDSDAAYGHTGGGTANQVLKSGTNTLHGAAMWKNQPNRIISE